MNKEQKLKLIRGLAAKVKRLQTLTRDHYNADGWDTEQSSKDAARLCDESIDITTILRNELA